MSSSIHPRVEDYMTRSPHSVGADQTISFARALMREHGIRHLPVLQAGKLVGILSDRDVFWIETLKEEQGEELLVEEAMSPIPYVVSPEAPLAEIAREMAEHKYGSAVVMRGDTVVGVFTTTDALRALAASLAQHGAQHR